MQHVHKKTLQVGSKNNSKNLCILKITNTILQSSKVNRKM
jgi:hypothetical protein